MKAVMLVAVVAAFAAPAAAAPAATTLHLNASGVTLTFDKKTVE